MIRGPYNIEICNVQNSTIPIRLLKTECLFHSLLITDRLTIENMQDSLLADTLDEVAQLVDSHTMVPRVTARTKNYVRTTCFEIPASLRDWCHTQRTTTSAGAVPRNFTVHKKDT